MDPKKEEQERLRSLLVDTVAFLCKRGLTYQNLRVQGLLTLTINDEDVVVVHINEFDQKECKSPGSNTSTTSTECQDPPSAQQNQHPNLQPPLNSTVFRTGSKRQGDNSSVDTQATAGKHQRVSGSFPHTSYHGKYSQPRFQSNPTPTIKQPQHVTPLMPVNVKDRFQSNPMQNIKQPQDVTPLMPVYIKDRENGVSECEEDGSEANEWEQTDQDEAINNMPEATKEGDADECSSEHSKEINNNDEPLSETILNRNLTKEMLNKRLKTLFEMNGRSIDGTRVTIVKAEDHTPVSDAEDARHLFVGNLSFHTDPDSLKAAFTGCTAAEIPVYNDTGNSRGFGFVQFEDGESAQKALHSVKILDGRRLNIDAYSRHKRSFRFKKKCLVWTNHAAVKSVPVSGTVEDNGRQDETPQEDREEL